MTAKKIPRGRRPKDHAARPDFPGLSNPNRCGLPTRLGACPQHLLTQTDRNGTTVLYCAVHGERPAPILRPEQFVRYDQRERFMEELRKKVGRAETEHPRPHENYRRYMKDVPIVGYALARKLDVL